MRQLGLDELKTISNDYFSDVEYADHDEVKDKLTQLMNFLYHQDISQSTLKRIHDDYIDLYNKVDLLDSNSPEEIKKEVVETLLTPDEQGAFGYFLIDKKFRETKKNSHHYIELAWLWYDKGTDYFKMQKGFNSYFLNPFKELFKWYLLESQPRNDSDYFSKESQEKIFQKLDDIEEMLLRQGFGQEIIFNEIEDLKKLTYKLSQKNWKEIIKGKFWNLIIDKVISLESAEKAFKILTGNEFRLL